MTKTTWQGRLQHVDLEGGVWQLHTKDGVFALRGTASRGLEVPKGLEGQEVVVEGEQDEGFGFDMTGPAIAVRGLRRK